MYDFDYEDDTLAALGVLKLLKERQPDRFDCLLKQYKTLEWQVLEELTWEAIWELFDTAENDFDQEFEAEVWIIQDESLDTFWVNLQQRARASGGYSDSACRGLIRDIVEYFLCRSGGTIGKIECHTHSGFMSVRLWISPDVFEPMLLGCDIVAFLQYLQAENEKSAMRSKHQKAKKEAA